MHMSRGLQERSSTDDTANRGKKTNSTEMHICDFTSIDEVGFKQNRDKEQDIPNHADQYSQPTKTISA